MHGGAGDPSAEYGRNAALGERGGARMRDEQMQRIEKLIDDHVPRPFEVDAEDAMILVRNEKRGAAQLIAQIPLWHPTVRHLVPEPKRRSYAKVWASESDGIEVTLDETPSSGRAFLREYRPREKLVGQHELLVDTAECFKAYPCIDAVAAMLDGETLLASTRRLLREHVDRDHRRESPLLLAPPASQIDPDTHAEKQHAVFSLNLKYAGHILYWPNFPARRVEAAFSASSGALVVHRVND